MIVVLIFAPLLGSIISGLFGNVLGRQGTASVTIFAISVSFFFTVVSNFDIIFSRCSVFIRVSTWITSNTLHVDWGIMFDFLTSCMCFVVCFISLLVHVYSTEYMANDPHVPRFMSYLSLFTFFMLILVTGDNFLQMFVGWEGVGLCSFLLINFWFLRIQANKAAIKAMLINRVGDFSIVLGILVMFLVTHSVDYSTIAVLTPFFVKAQVIFLGFPVNFVDIVALLLFLGAVGKSAQVGLHMWLPDAMEGPTPVSALIHAATMVTAGVFLLVRTSFLFQFSDSVLNFIVVVGSITAFLASSTGLVQSDLKKVIAYSTCSQLGYMVFACGLSNFNLGLFHLTTHAFFKALLFLGAGSVIHAVSDEQDMRKMGGLKLFVPVTYSCMVIGSLALIGFPFLSGYYSKDLILEVGLGKHTVGGYFSFFFGLISVFLTSFYSTRLVCLTFLTKPAGSRAVLCYAIESEHKILLPLICLTAPSLFFGYLGKDLIIGMGNLTFSGTIFQTVGENNLFDAEFGISPIFKVLPLIFSIVGVSSSFFLYLFGAFFLFHLKFSEMFRGVYSFLNRKWFFDKLLNDYITQSVIESAYDLTYRYVDRGVFEVAGPTGVSILVQQISRFVNLLSSYSLYQYNLILISGVIYLSACKLVNNSAFFTFGFFHVAICLSLLMFLLANKAIFLDSAFFMESKNRAFRRGK